MKRVAIIGAGESGLGAALLAKKEGYAVFVTDAGVISESRKVRLQAEGIDFEEGKHTEEKVLHSDLIIKSPGIPEKASLIQKAIQEGIAVIDELEFASRFSKGKVIAITGTNGKTTTTLLTYHLMKEAGLDVGLAGNVGQSWAAQLVDQDHNWWVLECSSFQIDGMISFRPTIGMLTNITPDHLDRYDYQVEKYMLSKLSLFKNQLKDDFAVYYKEDPISLKGFDSVKLKAQMLPVSLEGPSENGAFLEGETLMVQVNGKKVSIPESALPLKGKHNVLNTLFASTAAVLAGVNEGQLLEGLKTFKNAPHRMEPVGEINGVNFINDSKGTNVEATYYALGSFQNPLIWIAGGVDKGNDYSVLLPETNGKVKALICLGKDNEKLKKAFSGSISEIRETQKIAEAVRWGLDMGEAGDTVLLSPACASFDLFKNYEDRGNQFRSAVQGLKLEVSA
ncbi:UDP-N-acetylmuramoyl-L-alanine--D-glutamate ligase [Algoriphagus zhangzhouensis]|uniref:UDP-N-acetylmuramoylalanine--D-glutamate ligase n=1 Tax=Algoriphagus zhangzhouensis TaxID=1073327 RepID=A0A1M7Z9J4_9BACT|nr:UDP-N-acetylmuramoyl-L-alanine--D-glutamate ligase [Algoriphagus zhangzhouensis]TDY47441.1 UDP-N-acetylmuramoylalanine--D-glutamate ligase [Algoriphagus zhangzhouensis]SHO61479.1 UDP-N-acetylmuramoylalanine--D-glutamate ligase [Algoriphagus zhangzhouensis]